MGIWKISFNNLKVILFYASMFLLIMALSIKYNGLDVDLWARLIMGNHVFHKGLPMYSDVVSYTQTHVWYDPEWLSSAFIYFIRLKFGVVGLTLTKGFLFFLTLFVVSKAVKVRANGSICPYNIGFYILLILISLQSSIIVYSLRCQLLTFLLMAIWLYLLEKVRSGNDKLLYFLPFIMLLWLNVHGGCIAGVGILFLYGIGEFLNKKPCKKYFITLLFVCLVFLINPWGFDYIKFMIESSYLDRSWISEWQSPFVASLKSHIFYKILLFGAFACLGYEVYIKKLTYRMLDKTKIIILVVLAILSAKYIKHSGLFIVVYAIFMYEDFYFVYNNLMERLRKYLQIDFTACKYLSYLKFIFIYFIIYTYSFFVFMTVPVKYSHYARFFEHFPVQPLRFLEINNIEGKIFSGFYNGSFIAYKYYPKLKIYMDGRQEQVYSSRLFDESMFFLNWLGDYPEAAIKKIKPDILLIENFWRCNKHLKNNPEFTKVYSDNKYSVYLRNNIQKFGYKYPDKEFENYLDNLFDTVFDYSKAKN